LESNFGVGFSGYQYGLKKAEILLGLNVFQKSVRETKTRLALALYQQVKEKSRSFAFLSNLQAE